MKILLYIIICLFSKSIFSQTFIDKDEDLDNNKFIGKIKTIKEVLSYENRKKKFTFKYQFDQNICLTEKTQYFFKNESLIKRKVFIYDTNKNISEIKSSYNISIDSLKLDTKFSYDENQNLISIECINFKVEFVYDKNNLLIKKIYIYSSDKEETFYENKSNGTIVNSNRSIMGNLIKYPTYFYTFTKENKISELKSFPNNGKNQKTFKHYEYDIMGNLTEYNPHGNGPILKYTSSYDDIGNWIEKKVYKDDTLIKSFTS